MRLLIIPALVKESHIFKHILTINKAAAKINALVSEVKEPENLTNKVSIEKSWFDLVGQSSGVISLSESSSDDALRWSVIRLAMQVTQGPSLVSSNSSLG